MGELGHDISRGTRSSGGAPEEFKGGAFELALRSGRPILPIVIDGTCGRAPQEGIHTAREHAIRIRVLEPISPPGLPAPMQGRSVPWRAGGSPRARLRERRVPVDCSSVFADIHDNHPCEESMQTIYSSPAATSASPPTGTAKRHNPPWNSSSCTPLKASAVPSRGRIRSTGKTARIHRQPALRDGGVPHNPSLRPLIVAEAVWQYSHHVLAGSHTPGTDSDGRNWSGMWPGLVGMLNLTAV